MVSLQQLIALFIPSVRSEKSEPDSHRRLMRQNKQKAHSTSERVDSTLIDPIKTGILVFLTLFLALMAVAALVGGLFIAPKSDKIAMGLFAVFAGTLKGMLSVTKMLIR